MKLFQSYWKKYWLPFSFAVLCVFAEAVCDLLQPTIMSHIIDDGVATGNLHTVWRLGALMLFVTGIGLCLAITRNYVSSNVSQRFGADLRFDLYQKVMSLSLPSADKIGSGSLITRITNDVSQVTQFVHGLMRIFVKAPLTCIGSIILAIILNPRLSFILFGAIIIVTLLIIVSMNLSYRRYSKVQYAIDGVNTTVQEYLMGVRLVKAFGMAKQEEQRFETVNETLTQTNISAQRVNTVFSPLMSLAMNIGIAAVIYLGSLMFSSNAVQVGQIIAFTNYMTQILGSLMHITNMFNNFVRTRASASRIEEVFAQQDTLLACTDTTSTQHTGLSFDHITFSYPQSGSLAALQDIHFQIELGETLAVIGPTGSGKSTLVWLLLRFYDPQHGTIRLDGKDIRNIEPAKLRAKISVAPQQSMLFSGTVASNICFSNNYASQQEMIDAATVAAANEFILQMPQQYESVLGQSGVNLSGGQKQRISIARAALKKADILVLDDATSALDAVTEARVRQNLKHRKKGQTLLLITQRIGTAKGADHILVLDDGRMAGFGTHQQLMETCETYRDIYHSQIGEEDVSHG